MSKHLGVPHLSGFSASLWFVICHWFVSCEPPCSIREEHLIKEHCGLSGIMGYVTFHHKTRRGLSIVFLLHEKQLPSCFSQLRKRQSGTQQSRTDIFEVVIMNRHLCCCMGEKWRLSQISPFMVNAFKGVVPSSSAAL